jgi:hypothetical protein
MAFEAVPPPVRVHMDLPWHDGCGCGWSRKARPRWQRHRADAVLRTSESGRGRRTRASAQAASACRTRPMSAWAAAVRRACTHNTQVREQDPSGHRRRPQHRAQRAAPASVRVLRPRSTRRAPAGA